MKNGNGCPKCGGKEIVRQTGDKLRAGIYGAQVSHYVCTKCGYLEQWIDERESLDTLREYFPKK